MVFMSLSYSLSAFMTTKASGETLCSLLDLYMEPEMPRPALPHPASPYSQLQHLKHLTVQV